MQSRRIVARYLTASGQVKILVDVPETLRARDKYAGFTECVIATFGGPITLFRIFDDAELARILASGKITGGTYAVKAERAYGASWGADKGTVIQGGNRLRGGRLGADLFLARFEASGRKFFHLGPEIDPIDPNGLHEQVRMMNVSRINWGLGASVPDVSVGDVDLFTVQVDGQIQKISPSEAKDLVDKRPTKDVDLRAVHGELLQGSIFGVDVRIYPKTNSVGTFWGVYLNDDRQIVSGALTKEDAVELAQISIKMRPEKPVPMDGEILARRRQYERHFKVDEDPKKIRGSYALKPKDRLMVDKGSSKLGIKAHSTLTVADVFQLKGERDVWVKLLHDRTPIVLYATHPNRLTDDPIALLDSMGSRILVRRKT